MAEETSDDRERLWPSADYRRQVARLRRAVGRRIHLVELKPDDATIGVHLSNASHELLAVLDFPRPDPSVGLAPHMILLDDGRGINLGRIARISLGRAFRPRRREILYEDPLLMERLLWRDRRLSHDFTAERARLLLGRALGRLPSTTDRLRPPKEE